MIRTTVLMFVMASLSGCGSDSESASDQPGEDDTIMEAQTEALEKAKQVEQTVLDRKQDIDAALDEESEQE